MYTHTHRYIYVYAYMAVYISIIYINYLISNIYITYMIMYFYIYLSVFIPHVKTPSFGGNHHARHVRSLCLAPMAGLGAPGPHGAAALGAAQRLTRDAQRPAVGGGRSAPRKSLGKAVEHGDFTVEKW